MRSDGNCFDFFAENKLTKLANLVQFKCTLTFLSGQLEGEFGPYVSPFVYATDLKGTGSLL